MRKGRPKVALILTAEERQRLESFAHRSRSAAALARRARIILACAEGTVGQLIVELDVGVLQPERAHEVRHRFNRRRSLLTVERILAGVEVADHFDPSLAVPLWPVALAGARFQLRPVHSPPWGSMVRCCARSLQPFCSMWNLRMASTVANPRKSCRRGRQV